MNVDAKINDVFVFLMASLFVMLEIFPTLYTPLNLLSVALVVTYYLLIFKRAKVSLKDLFFLSVSVFLIIVSREVSRIALFVSYVFLTFKSLYTRRNVNIVFFVYLISFLLVVLLYYLFGFNKSYDVAVWSGVAQSEVFRKGLGFVNPNRCMFFYLVIVLLAILKYKNNLVLVIIALSNTFLFRETGCKTVGFLVYALVGILFVYNVLSKYRIPLFSRLLSLLKRVFSIKKETISGISVFIVFVLMFILSYVLSAKFSGTQIDSLLTGRLSINNSYLSYGIGIINGTVTQDSPFDNGYLHMLLTKGALYFVLFSLIVFLAFYKKRISIIGLTVCAAILLVNFTEVIFLKYSVLFVFGFCSNCECVCRNRHLGRVAQIAKGPNDVSHSLSSI